MNIKLTKKQKSYLFNILVEGLLDDRKKDLRRHQDSPSISKEIKDEIKILESVISTLNLKEVEKWK